MKRKWMILGLASVCGVAAAWWAWRTMNRQGVGAPWAELGGGRGGGVSVVGSAPGTRARAEGVTAAQEANARAIVGALDDAARNAWCTQEQSKLFAQAVRERLDLTLDPSFGKWEAQAAKFGAAVPKHPVNDDAPVTPEQFDEASRMLAEASYAFEKGELRALMLGGKAQKIEVLGSFARALLRPKYPRPSDPEREGVTIMEWVVPATLKQADGTVSNVRVGFSYWWQGGQGGTQGRWVPHDVTVYLPPGPMSMRGHTL